MGTNIKVLLLCFCIQGDPMPQPVRLFLFIIYKKKLIFCSLNMTQSGSITVALTEFNTKLACHIMIIIMLRVCKTKIFWLIAKCFLSSWSKMKMRINNDHLFHSSILIPNGYYPYVSWPDTHWSYFGPLRHELDSLPNQELSIFLRLQTFDDKSHNLIISAIVIRMIEKNSTAMLQPSDGYLRSWTAWWAPGVITKSRLGFRCENAHDRREWLQWSLDLHIVGHTAVPMFTLYIE